MSNTAHPVLNPNTPFAFLPPDIANQDEFYRYVVVASLGAYSCNILSNVDSHYKLIFKCRFSPSTIAYFISIIATLAYIIGCVAFHIGSVGNCQTVAVALASSFSVAVPATSFLFYLRVCAVFNRERTVVYTFGIFWLALLGSCMTLPFAVYGASIGPTNHCIDSGVRPFSSAGIIASTVYDSLTLTFISWKLLNNAMVGKSFGDKLRAFSGRNALPALSKALLQGGQIYYLIMVVGNVATTVMLLSPIVPPVLHAALTTPNVTLMNCMACKVFRDVKFGRIGETASELPSFPQSLPISQSSSHTSQTTHSHGAGVYRPPMEIMFHPESVESFPSDHKDMKELEEV